MSAAELIFCAYFTVVLLSVVADACLLGTFISKSVLNQGIHIYLYSIYIYTLFIFSLSLCYSALGKTLQRHVPWNPKMGRTLARFSLLTQNKVRIDRDSTKHTFVSIGPILYQRRLTKSPLEPMSIHYLQITPTDINWRGE